MVIFRETFFKIQLRQNTGKWEESGLISRGVCSVEFHRSSIKLDFPFIVGVKVLMALSVDVTVRKRSGHLEKPFSDCVYNHFDCCFGNVHYYTMLRIVRVLCVAHLRPTYSPALSRFLPEPGMRVHT